MVRLFDVLLLYYSMKNDQIEFIYKITSSSGKIYIGKTKDINRRRSCYKNISCYTQPKLYNSLLKYGWESHKFEVIERVFTIKILEREEYWIDYYKCNYNRYPEKNGLNLTDGGEQGGVNMIRVYQYNIDGTFIREWESQANACRYLGLQNHISQACTGKLKTFANYRWSYKKMDSFPELKGYRTSKKYFDIMQIDKKGNTIKIWDNISHIKMNMNIIEGHLASCINGVRKTHRGYIWKLKYN